jgi:hypothetical protein
MAKFGVFTQSGSGTDALPRPLRARFWQQVSAGARQLGHVNWNRVRAHATPEGMMSALQATTSKGERTILEEQEELA